MYSITVRDMFGDDEVGDLLYSDQSNLDETKVGSVKMTLEVNAAGSLTITVPTTNRCYNDIQRLRTEFIVWRNDISSTLKELWRGRILTEEKDFYNSRVFTCEGALAYLNDTIQPPNVYINNTIETYLGALLDIHNSAVNDARKIYLGTVTVEDENETKYRSTSYETTMDCILNLVDEYGGMFRIRRGNDGKAYLDYLADFPETSAQEVRFGSNLLDITRTWDLSEFATAVIPLGTLPEEDTYDYIFRYEARAYTDPTFKRPMLTDEIYDKFFNGTMIVVSDSEFAKPLRYYEAHDIGTVDLVRVDPNAGNNHGRIYKTSSRENYYPMPEEYLTVESVNDGKIDIVSSSGVDAYGYICKVVNFDDVTDPETLMLNGLAYLTTLQYDGLTVEVKMFDLHYANPDIDSVNLLDAIHVVSKIHDMDKIFYVTKVEIPFDNPSNGSITLNGSIDGKNLKLSTMTNGAIKATSAILGAKANKPKHKATS